MSAAPEDGAGLEPFSPSVFLDLPPTPRPDDDDGDGEDDPAALPDDLVLPFIERMLMEEDMDNKFFYQYPDHPALLQAQQPFADILSDASWSPPTDSSSSGGGGATLTVSPSSSDDNAAFFLPGHDGGEASQPQQRPETNTGDDGQSRVDMEMLNQAFLKGMEEANKLLLLPTASSSSSLLISGETKRTKVEEAADGIIEEALPFQGRGRKNSRRNWDDDDGSASEGRRSSKVVVPEQEETGDTVDKLVLNGYALCLDQMESLRIAMGTGGTSSTNGKAKKKTSASSEEAAVVVDLSTSLIHCADAVSRGDHRSAAELLRQIKRHASPIGDADQRLAYCFAEGLQARLAGAGSTLYRSLMVKRTSVVDFLRAYHLYLAATCFKMSAFSFSNMAIRKAVAAGKTNKLHIVDYGVDYGCQWPNLLRDLAKRRPPPEVRMTCIGVPEPGFRPAARIEETGRRLATFARQCGLPFTFRTSVAARWETVRAADLDIRANEVLVVNSIAQFQNLMDDDDDEGVDDVRSSRSSSPPRDAVLNNIREMRPDVFVLAVANASHSAPFFISRFRDALFYYSAMFDILDATAPRGDERRLVVERYLIGRCALNVVACEGADRVERPETYRQWQARCRRAGLRQLPLCPDVVKVLTDRVRKQNHRDFFVDVDRQWLVQGWKGRILYAMSTWVADD
ncbi:hypothetical protein U9M48_000225 [Paspalum notatum var. saurae]|uniref:Uncharacterized protein n=1 Tax=Paspalum notatum var. saurae TaxID=547442 RepID=A0AAQ3SCA3_PASNO